jgi:hypothetical protein
MASYLACSSVCTLYIENGSIGHTLYPTFRSQIFVRLFRQPCWNGPVSKCPEWREFTPTFTRCFCNVDANLLVSRASLCSGWR